MYIRKKFFKLKLLTTKKFGNIWDHLTSDIKRCENMLKYELIIQKYYY